MAVISPPILKILSDLDIDLMDVDSDMDYLRALMEATNSLTISNPSDRRIPILQKEVKRVRDNRRAKSQIVKKKVSTSKLLNRKDVGEKVKESNTGRLSRILRDTRGRVLSNEKRLDNLKSEENQQEGSDNQDFNPIIDGLNSIIETLRSDRKFNKKKTEKQRKEKEKTKRASKEKLLEGAKGVWKGVSKIAGKVLGPFADIWSKILGFITKIFLGRVLFKLVDWVGNPANQDKIKSIFRFLKDWWPLLLGAYVVFGTGLFGFATGLISSLVGFATALTGTVIPALVKAAIAMGPWGWAALAILGTGAAVTMAVRNKNKDKDKKDNISTDKQNQVKETTSEISEVDISSGGTDAAELKTRTDDSRQGFNKGGKVPGRGANKDTVPAMLTPGEFVMSRDAVDQWGADTLAGMNAAAGGTNRPTIMGGYKGGGKAADRSHFGTTGYRMGQVMPEQFVYSHEKYTSTYKTKGGEVVEDSDDFKEIFGAIGMPDLIEHQKQLVDSLRKVEGYENINFMDVVQYPHGQGRLVGMPPEKLYPILNASDAYKATEAKMDEAIRIDEEAGTLYLDPRETAKAVGLNAGGLVQSQIDQYKKLKLERSRIERDPDGKIRGADRKKWNQLSKEMAKLAKQIEASQKSTSTPTVTPKASKTKKGGGFGLKRMIGGAADMATGHMFDFDKRSGGGGLRKTANAVKRGIGGALDFATLGMWDFDKRNPEGSPKDWGIRRMAGGLTDWATMGLTDFDKRGAGNLQFNPMFGGKDKKWGVEPSSKKPKVTVAYQDQLTDSTPSTPSAGGNKKIPSFSAIAMRSVDKIRVLGISV